MLLQDRFLRRMGMELNHQTLETLIRFRMALFGSGSIQRTEDGQSITCILPGQKTIVRLWREGEQQMAQLHSASIGNIGLWINDDLPIDQLHHIVGNPVCPPLSIQHPWAFMGFIHSLDCSFVYDQTPDPICSLIKQADVLFHRGDRPSIGYGNITLGDKDKSMEIWTPTTPEAHAAVKAGIIEYQPADTDISAFSEISLQRWKHQTADLVLGSTQGNGTEGFSWKKLNNEQAAAMALRLEHDDLRPFMSTSDLIAHWVLESKMDGTPQLLVSFGHGMDSIIDGQELNDVHIYALQYADMDAIVDDHAEDVALLLAEHDVRYTPPRSKPEPPRM
jgi:hypothetical protein